MQFLKYNSRYYSRLYEGTVHLCQNISFNSAVYLKPMCTHNLIHVAFNIIKIEDNKYYAKLSRRI